MNQLRHIVLRAAMTAASLVPVVARAQAAAAAPVPPPSGACQTDAVVSFGVLNNNPTPAPHALDPNEVTIQPGGTVTFQMVSSGHKLALYPVSQNTTRDTIDPQIAQIAAGASSTLVDGKGAVIIDLAKDPTASYINDPANRIALAIGSQNPTSGVPGNLPGPVQPLPPAPPVPVNVAKPGASLQYRFPTSGRYLVICASRTHFNDHMYGFVEVGNCGAPQTPPNTPPPNTPPPKAP